ncbi:MAG: hypothetical protein KUL87_17970, partial [Pseudomonas sp.]|nr:hypothetical protein [Pseudomonas sp.]
MNLVIQAKQTGVEHDEYLKRAPMRRAPLRRAPGALVRDRKVTQTACGTLPEAGGRRPAPAGGIEIGRTATMYPASNRNGCRMNDDVNQDHLEQEFISSNGLVLPDQQQPDKLYIIPVHNRPFFPA